MRSNTTAAKVRSFMDRLGRAARGPGRVYLTGGASAILLGWRPTTIDIHCKFDPEPAAVFEALPRLKDELDVNVELAAPDDFIPPLPGWRDRSVFIARHGAVDFYHYDFSAQALAKLERGHAQDLADVRSMLRGGLVEAAELRRLYAAIEPALLRYPALDPGQFRAKVERFLEAEGRP